MTENETIAQSKRERFLEMGETEFNSWKHHHVTAAYLQFLADQIDEWRGLAADLIENGAFQLGAQAEVNNPDVLRGRIASFRELHRIDLQTIQGFYGQQTPEDETGK